MFTPENDPKGSTRNLQQLEEADSPKKKEHLKYFEKS